MMMRTLITAIGVLGLAGTALAQNEPRDFPAERMRPATNREGLIDLEWGAVPTKQTFDVGLFLKYNNDPLTLLHTPVGGSEARAGVLVGNLVNADILLSFVIASWLELGVHLPLMLYEDRPESITVDNFTTQLKSISAFGFGDLRLQPKLGILNSEDHGIDIGVMVGLTLPTGRSSDYLGDTGVGFNPELAITRAFGGFRLGLNFGYLLRERVQWLGLVVDDELQMRLGAAYRFGHSDPDPIEIGVTFYMATNAEEPFKRVNQTPLELLANVKYDVIPPVQLAVGGGVGLQEGFATPDFRLFAGIRISNVSMDSDGDGILDDVDRCPEVPEDADGFEDSDGCPDPDNDRDGVLDGDDGCPMDPEDADGFEDADGCPDPDNDADGVLDPVDACPLEAGPKDNRGCPVIDSDKDGLMDNTDGCPYQPEDADDFQDDDGCPDPDNDQDGVMDTADKCPLEHGPPENRGCPDTDMDGDGLVDRLDFCPTEYGPKDNDGCGKKPLASLKLDRIEIMEKVYFKSGSAEILSRSFELLDTVGSIIKRYDDIKRVTVEGHTDSRGAISFNQQLSERRAYSVMSYLIGKGVEVSRLRAIGYGEERPVMSNATAEGRQANRRVEFKVER